MSKLFRFKNFAVSNSKSAMKITTDTVLLPCLLNLSTKKNQKILDVGTGTGTIPLILAQRLSDILPKIEAIEIDEISFNEARDNFTNSPWVENLNIIHSSLQDFETTEKYDLIVSNPPFFEKSLNCPDYRKNRTRHTGENSLSYRELIEFAEENLDDNGVLAMILPASNLDNVKDYATRHKLVLSALVNIKAKYEDEKPNRIVVELSKLMRSNTADEKQSKQIKVSQLCIRKEGQYTAEYIALTKDFYLWEKK